jgi:hypothetical protein
LAVRLPVELEVEEPESLGASRSLAHRSVLRIEVHLELARRFGGGTEQIRIESGTAVFVEHDREQDRLAVIEHDPELAAIRAEHDVGDLPIPQVRHRVGDATQVVERSERQGCLRARARTSGHVLVEDLVEGLVGQLLCLLEQ